MMPPFDRGSPDPSPRPGADSLLFSARCGCNAVESGCRALIGAELHPRKFWNETRKAVVWREQTGMQIEVPEPPMGDATGSGGK